jgi:periplasmic protein TonB
MNKMPGQPPSRLPTRRSVAIATLGFIAISAALHVILGGSFKSPWPQPQQQQNVHVVSVDVFKTPPPTAVPTPVPAPQRTAAPVPHAPAPHKAASRHLEKLALPSRKGPAVLATAEPIVTEAPAPQPSSSAIAQPNATPIDARDIIISARFIHRAEPVYPQLAIERGAEGTVIVLVTIGPDGTASDVRISQSSGDASLDAAAVAAARASTFAPPQVDGQPATQTYRIIYTFYLD